MDESALNEHLHIMQWNARSVKCHLSDLKITAYSTKPHVIAIQESWLKKKDKTPGFISYFTHRMDRVGRKGGGLMLLVRKNLHYIPKTLISFQGGKLEVQAISIKSNNQFIDIMNVYNPRGTLNKNEFIHYKSQLHPRYIIVGDFNGHNPL